MSDEPDRSSADGDDWQPHLVADYRAAPERLRPIMALWDTSADWLLMRLDGVDDDEWIWAPGPRPWLPHRVDGRWAPARAADEHPDQQLRSIAWLAGHLAELGHLRSDWTTGTKSRQPADNEWPGGAIEGLAVLRSGLDAWSDTLGQLDDQDLDTVGRSAFPWGLDPQLPLLDIVWWNTRELIHHGADISVIRDLYAQLTNQERTAQ